MSIRTVIEINCDYIAQLDAQDWEDIKRMCTQHLDTKHYYQVSGVRVLGQRHHSETLKLEVK